MQQVIIFPTTERPQAPKMNPVYQEFRRLSLLLIERGFKRYGAKSIIERIRFETNLREGPRSSFKLNNNNTALYARMFMQEFPQHDGFFEVRRSRYDDILS